MIVSEERPIKNLVLIGFMGTGKSTVGQLLAEKLEWTFIDSDAALVSREGRSIPDIFSSDGEAYFRNAESRALADILSRNRQVVATGGGAVLREENRQLMKGQGMVVALTATAEAIIERVRQDTNRPLLQGDVEERVTSLLVERQPAYRFADVTIDTTDLSAVSIVEMIAGLIEQKPLNEA
ncbi:shikimate kinase [Paenibacillus gansuensis]|uniref:Shikimate kinase n=1 Tax=Paenibacillus gansuensis TaxID=306542 RepID=A0ABW5PCA7_9BACL